MPTIPKSFVQQPVPCAPRRFATVSALALASGFISAAITPQAALARAGAPENCTIKFNFDGGADLQALITQMARDTGRTVTIDRSVNGKVNIRAPEDATMCPDEAWAAFQNILRINGFVATPVDDMKYNIIPLSQGQRAPGPVGGTAGDGGLITQIFRLQYIDAQDAARNIALINSEGAVATAIRSSNSLMVVDSPANVQRFAQILSELDRDTREFRTVLLVNASAREVARVLTDVAKDLAEENGSAANRVSVVPVDASNSLLIRAEPRVMTKLANVIRELDRAGAASTEVAVIPLRHADAEEILPLLRETMGSGQANTGTPTPNGGGVSGGRQVISAYAATNSIVVRGDAVLRREVESIIQQLDVRRAQVLVEAIIVDISDSTAREVGVQYFISGSGDSFVPFSTNVSGQNPNILSAAGAAFTGALTPPIQNQSTVTTTAPDGTVTTTSNGQEGLLNPDFTSSLTAAAVGSLLGINGFGLGGAGTFGSGNIFGALLTALQQDGSSRVLSTPSVVTLNNQTASLSDGQEIPITTGEQIGDDFSNAFRTVNREQVGVILEVTPQITDGGTVQMEIRQEISSIAGPIIASSTDLITNNSEITTTALVDDGDILVIGGLISDDQAINEDKVPFLGDIPGVGNLFKTTQRSKIRNNLMIFIRPTIIRDRQTANAATRRKFDYIRAQEVLNDPRAQEDFNRLIDDITGIEPQN
ncbi:MAG: type II secretion system secretin GspD [Pseudomonadota bacterium]